MFTSMTPTKNQDLVSVVEEHDDRGMCTSYIQVFLKFLLS